MIRAFRADRIWPNPLLSALDVRRIEIRAIEGIENFGAELNGVPRRPEDS